MSHRGTFLAAGLASFLLIGGALAATSARADTLLDPLHGYCAGAGQCVDNGTNSPTTNNPPTDFGFTVSPGPKTGTLYVDVLVPNDALQPIGGFSLTGTLPGTASLLSSTAWTSSTKFLDSYLGISASPNNPIGAFLPSTKALDPTATGFYVYQADLGSTELNKAKDPNSSPLESISPDLALGSYIVGFLEVPGKNGSSYIATANSGAIFETGKPTPVPEPGSLAILGTGLLILGLAGFRRRLRFF